MKLIVYPTLLLSLIFLSQQCIADPAVDEDSENQTAETFEIDGHIYIIPEPWTGHRIAAPSPASIRFSQISQAHTRDGTKVYIKKGANTALQKLLDAAKNDGVYLLVESGFRSYNYQMRIFTRLMRSGRNTLILSATSLHRDTHSMPWALPWIFIQATGNSPIYRHTYG